MNLADGEDGLGAQQGGTTGGRAAAALAAWVLERLQTRCKTTTSRGPLPGAWLVHLCCAEGVKWARLFYKEE